MNCKLKTEISPREMRWFKKEAAQKVELIHILGSEITVSSTATLAGDLLMIKLSCLQTVTDLGYKSLSLWLIHLFFY